MSPIEPAGPHIHWIRWAIPGAVLVTAIILALFIIPNARPAVDRSDEQYPAALYIKPTNCTLPEIQAGEQISQDCYWPTYELQRPVSRIGIYSPFVQKGTVWIRIGNDALNIFCGFSSNCTIEIVIKDKFYQPRPNNKAPIDPTNNQYLPIKSDS